MVCFHYKYIKFHYLVNLKNKWIRIKRYWDQISLNLWGAVNGIPSSPQNWKSYIDRDQLFGFIRKSWKKTVFKQEMIICFRIVYRFCTCWANEFLRDTGKIVDFDDVSEKMGPLFLKRAQALLSAHSSAIGPLHILLLEGRSQLSISLGSREPFP